MEFWIYYTFIKVPGWIIGNDLKRDFSPENIPFKIRKFGILEFWISYTFIKVRGWTIGFHLKRDFSPENIPFKIGKFGILILL